MKIEGQSFHTLLDWSSPSSKASLMHVCLPLLLAISGPIHVCLPLLLTISGPIHVCLPLLAISGPINWLRACAWSLGYANIWLCPLDALEWPGRHLGEDNNSIETTARPDQQMCQPLHDGTETTLLLLLLPSLVCHADFPVHQPLVVIWGNEGLDTISPSWLLPWPLASTCVPQSQLCPPSQYLWWRSMVGSI